MQRVFDLSIEKDQMDLFDLLPDDTTAVCKDYTGLYIIRKNFPRIEIGNSLNVICKDERIHFHITRPENPKDWIGKLCWFWDYDDTKKGLGVLLEIEDEQQYPYKTTVSLVGGTFYKHCSPVKREEIEFVK